MEINRKVTRFAFGFLDRKVRKRLWERKEGKKKKKEYIPDEVTPIIEVISRDIDRCYPNHIMFRDVNGQGYNSCLWAFPWIRTQNFHNKSQKLLFDILKAYTGYNPEIGYAQGMGMIVGMFLMHMPDQVVLLSPTEQLNKKRIDSKKKKKFEFDKKQKGCISALGNYFGQKEVSLPLLWWTAYPHQVCRRNCSACSNQ